MAKIALGMSGGVDSSVAVHLLQEAGWDVQGIHLQLTDDHGASTQQAARDAQAVADHFNIPLAIIEARDLFKHLVTDPFIESYRKGQTPNPCVRCNRLIKFGHLWALAQKMGCHHLATGHYVRIEHGPKESALYRTNNHKDQSYFLYGIPRGILPQLQFPLGLFNKDETRQIAAKLSLPVAQKKDSQDICFIPDNDYARWLSNTSATLPDKGIFIDETGTFLGKHHGAWRYTIGQRKGLGLALGYPAYVTDINAEKGLVTVGRDASLWHHTLTATELNWLTDIPSEGTALAQIRSRDIGHPCRYHIKDDHLEIIFDQSVRAVTPGQSIVLYHQQRVLGGGIIQ